MKRWLCVFAAVALLGSCRNQVLSPSATIGGAETLFGRAQRPEPIGDDPGALPRLVSLKTRVAEGELQISARLTHGSVPFEPVIENMQIALDVDQNWQTGGEGLCFNETTCVGGEFLVRPRRDNGDLHRLAIRSTLENGPPDPQDGGWGAITGYARIDQRPRDLDLAIPLSALKQPSATVRDDGYLNGVMTFYATEGIYCCISYYFEVRPRRGPHGQELDVEISEPIVQALSSGPRCSADR